MGLSVQPVTPALANRLGLEKAEGLAVTAVDPSGPAADAGFRAGDVILDVDGSPVTSAAELRAAVGRAGGRPALVLVRRGDATLYLTLSSRES